MSKQLKVAVIGTGAMGNMHIKAWQGIGHEVVSVTDVDLSRARAASEQFGVGQVYADYKEAAADPQVDVVSICLPLAFHAPVTIFAAEQGKHIFCEKPLARNFIEANEMEEAVRRAGVQFGLGLQRNLGKGVGLLKKWVTEDRFGHPLVFSAENLMEVRPKIAMHDRNGNNGPLTDFGCHVYILWQTVLQSKPKSVYAQGRIFARGHSTLENMTQLAIDTAVVTAEYESGDVATFTVSWGLPTGFKMRGGPYRIIGPKGGAEGEPNTGFRVYDGDQMETVELDRLDLHQTQFGMFAEAIEQGKRPAYSFPEGKQVLALTQAIFESIDTGRPVPVSYNF